MRRASVCASGMGPGGGEPLIVVEESAFAEEEADADGEDSPGVSAGSPPCPYLLSPWRDTRKHSLPTPACTSGPTASQVRRLSERGEGAAREAREAAFLATLSQAAPQPGGRRHSVVTISRVPQSLFGRGRRESVAAFPSRPGSIKRRDSTAIYCPPSTENLGSTHNLQLDIMDDIVTSRKVRVRLSGAGCEVTPLGASGAPLQYSHATARRHSDFAALTPPPIPPRRRASELPPPPMPPPPPPPNAGRGIVCTDTDLRTILNSLTSSATEINRCGEATPRPTRPRLATARSTSFDGSALGDCDTVVSASGWLAKRHQTLAVKRAQPGNRAITVTFADEKRQPAAPGKVVWDKPSGSLVDAEALGSAIEVFLRRGSTNASAANTNVSSASTTSVPIVSVSGPTTGRAEAGWCPPRAEEEAEGCEANICSTLKDLFVK